MPDSESNGAPIPPNNPTKNDAASSGQRDDTGCSQPRRTTATGPRTPEGKKRSARNASTHKILVGRILPEEVKLASYLCEELLRELDPQTLLGREIVLDLVVNRLRKRRIDRYNVNSIAKSRARRFETLFETEQQSQAEPWLRFTDTGRANSAVWKRLTPEACVELLGHLRARVQERGPSPEEDMEVLGRVYGQEPTALGAMIGVFYGALQSNCYQGNERDEKGKVQYEKLRDEILEALEKEIQHQRSRVTDKVTRWRLDISRNIVLPPSSIENSIQRYHAANAREFAHLLDAFERVGRVQKA